MASWKPSKLGVSIISKPWEILGEMLPGHPKKNIRNFNSEDDSPDVIPAIDAQVIKGSAAHAQVQMKNQFLRKTAGKISRGPDYMFACGLGPGSS